MSWQSRRACSLLMLLPFASVLVASAASALPYIQANSNQSPAGTLGGKTLAIELEIREGEWFPENDRGPSLKVFCFAEKGKASQIPGPLIRVREGTTIHASIRNLLAAAVVLHGMHSRPGKADDVLQLAPGMTGEVTFEAGVPGAYYYWASAGGDTWNGRPYKEDSQLSGAFIVDPANGALPDRVFLLGVWRDQALPYKSLDIATINGKSWPYTERIEYTAGEPVRWRVLNPSNVIHPMHLHGFYYRVDSLGDGERDIPFAEAERKMIVTEVLPVGGTMTTRWVPERSGRWIFHCHILAHISPDRSSLRTAEANNSVTPQHDHLYEMSGLVLGITILPRSGTARKVPTAKARRKLQLIVANLPGAGPSSRGYALRENNAAASGVSSPGPAIVLTRGEPVSIRIVNRLKEPTAVHWHGIELESYYDGVPGWTGDALHTTPMILPGKSFEVRFTPPRAGTFIYHTHAKDLLQLSSGLYGPIIVLPQGEKLHPETDKVFLISRYGIRKEGGLLLNGATNPVPLHWQARTNYRLRFINISPNITAQVALTRDGAVVQWASVAKDGADLPAAQALTGPAAFSISPGETYDFQFRAEQDGDLELTAEVGLLKEKVAEKIELDSAVASK